MPAQPTIRPTIAADIEPIMEIVHRTKFFRSIEEEIAREVLTDSLTDPSYQSYALEVQGKVCGWICFGPTACTIGTYDIYWIAVEPACQHQGFGSQLLAFAEQQIARQGGRLMVIETSGSPLYQPTQRFYEKNGYQLVARVDDFYAEGDPKLIFTKKTAPFRP